MMMVRSLRALQQLARLAKCARQVHTLNPLAMSLHRNVRFQECRSRNLGRHCMHDAASACQLYAGPYGGAAGFPRFRSSLPVCLL